MTNEIILPPIHPNAGIEAAYRKRLLRLVDEMDKSVSYWSTCKTSLGMDATPAEHMRDILRKLTRRWVGIFNKASEAIAERVVMDAMARVDRTLAGQFAKHDFTVEFKFTDEMRNAVQAVIGDNVALIRNIPVKYMTDVEGMVMRSVAVGGNRKQLADELVARHGMTRKRAAFIASDQNAKANAVIMKVRQEEIGCTEAVWLHSGGGREPRPDHVKANGHRYKIATGMKLDDGWVYPGQLPRCRCVSRTIVPLFDK